MFKNKFLTKIKDVKKQKLLNVPRLNAVTYIYKYLIYQQRDNNYFISINLFVPRDNVSDSRGCQSTLMKLYCKFIFIFAYLR